VKIKQKAFVIPKKTLTFIIKKLASQKTNKKFSSLDFVAPSIFGLCKLALELELVSCRL
jgi:hypothetical protein